MAVIYYNIPQLDIDGGLAHVLLPCPIHYSENPLYT